MAGFYGVAPTHVWRLIGPEFDYDRPLSKGVTPTALTAPSRGSPAYGQPQRALQPDLRGRRRHPRRRLRRLAKTERTAQDHQIDDERVDKAATET